MSEQSYDAIIIGAGFGGSSCAGLLAKRGLKVLLLEKNAVAGGKALSLSKSGFTYTAWVVIGAPVQDNLYQVVLDDLGVADLATLIVPGQQGSIYRTPGDKFVRMPDAPSEQLDPTIIFDWLEIEEEKRASALQFMAEMTLMPPEKVAELSGTNFDSWLTAANLPTPLYAFLVSLCCDGMFMVPVDSLDAAEAISSLQAMFLRGGGVFCKGGFGRIAEAYCEGVRRHSGEVLMSTRVDEIIVEDGRVVGVATDKGRFEAPIVISNAGLQPTVLKLVGEQHFDEIYANYVRDLVPSYSLIGYRYFLDKPVTDAPFGVIFSNTSPWSLERFNEACAGKASREGVLYYEVPSNYDPDAAPEGKQMLMTGSFCPPDPELSKQELEAWAHAGEQTLFSAFPELESCIESKDFYSTRSVSNATRDAVLPGVGGETIGLGQIVGQCGEQKPSIQAPVRGLFYVGCDAGGTGVGTQQAIESGMNVADTVGRYHDDHQAS
ncbi:MAG: NAD(P)/FAD-dependent oxidoreductase [Myxococcota bacterium]|jgi:prolycopene isomerase|nr:NAD(P)/FAD-dependent oxidoreductase [Myxococcota bacterium]